MKTQQGDERKSITVRNNTEPIPFDMIVEIFTRLPGKSLIKFKCISKTWCSIINTRSFSDSFISISLSRPRILFADIIRSVDESHCHFRFFSSPYPPRKSDDSSQLSMIYKLNIPLTDKFQSYQYTSLRGFIFIGSLLPHRKSMVCNPITKQVISLPHDPVLDNIPQSRYYMFLGYDPSKDQYKVLRVILPQGSPVVDEYSVCTLGGGEPSSLSWRCIDKKLSSYRWLQAKGVCINGVLYFITSGIERRIESFDVGSEKLSFIDVPGNITDLINHRGKLAAISTRDGDCFSLWVFEEDKKQKWSKIKFVVPSLKLNVEFKGTTNDGELIFEPNVLSNNPYVVYYFDMRKATLRKVTLEGITNVDGFEVDNENFIRKFISYGHVDNIITL